MKRCKKPLLFIVSLAIALCFKTPALASDQAAQWSESVALLDSDSPGAFWLPSNEVPLKGTLLCLHGFGLNASSYEALGKAMAARGYAVFAPDIRGFGYWRATGIHPKLDLKLAVDDVCKIVRALKAVHPELPLYILGESMGGAIGLTAVSVRPQGIAGLIAVVPAAQRFRQKKASASVALRYLKDADKEFSVEQKLVARAVSDEQLRRMWLADARNRLHVSPRELLQFQRFMNAAMEHVKQIRNTPVLIVQGCRDNLVRPDATIRLYNNVPNQDKHLLMVGQAEHLIFQKGQFTNQTFEMLMGWLKHDENQIREK